MFLENDIDSLLRGLHCDARSKRCWLHRLPHTAILRRAACSTAQRQAGAVATEAVAKLPAVAASPGLRHAGRYALHQAIGSLLEDYSLVSFVPLDISTVRRYLTPIAITANRPLRAGPFCGRWESVALSRAAVSRAAVPRDY